MERIHFNGDFINNYANWYASLPTRLSAYVRRSFSLSDGTGRKDVVVAVYGLPKYYHCRARIAFSTVSSNCVAV